MWVKTWEDFYRQKEREAHDKATKSLETQLREANFEIGQINLQKTACEEELSATRSQLTLVLETNAKKEDEMRHAAEIFADITSLREQQQRAIEQAANAERLRDEAEADVAKMRAANQEMLERLLGEQREKLEAEIAKLKARLKEKGDEEDTAMAGFKKELQERASRQQREQRVELIKKQISRRIMYRDVARGWTAWTEYCDARTYAMGRLRQAAGRLGKPNVSLAFHSWVGVWNDARYAKAVGDARAYAALEGELAACREKLEEVLADRRQLRDKLTELDGGVAEAERLREEQLQAEKGERVALLHRQMTRRMMNSGVTSGWAAWHELWSAKTYALSTLRRAANKLHNGRRDLDWAFGVWADECEEVRRQADLNSRKTREEQLEAKVEQLETLLEETKVGYEQRLLAAADDKRLALERQAVVLTGTAEEVAAAKEAQEKEARIELLRRQIGRRMANTELTRGWSAWTDFVDAKNYAMGRLRDVGNRLHKPNLAGAFVHWARLTQAFKVTAKMSEAERREAELQQARLEMSQELAAMRDEFEGKLTKAAQEKNFALQKQAVELTGSAEALAELKAAQEREQRVELLRRQSVRRIQNRGLFLGWAAWHEFWSAKTYAMGRLLECGRRLQKPEVSHAFREFVANREEAHMAAERAELKKKREELGAQLREASFERDQLRLLKTAHESEIEWLRTRLTTAHEEIEEQAKVVKRMEDMEKENDEVRKLMSDSTGGINEEKEKLEHLSEEARRRIRENQELLERLLSEQREAFDAEAARMESKVRELLDEEWTRERKKMQERLEERDASAKTTQTILTNERDAAQEEARKIKTEMMNYQEASEENERKLEMEIIKLKKQISKLEEEIAAAAAAAEKKPHKIKGSPLGMKFDIDEGPDAKPISQQLADALRKNSARVIDLFRSWDENGDGEVSRAEFQKAMPALGLEVPKKDINDLFDSWDKDGGGALGLRELQKILSSSRVQSGKKGESKGVAAVAAVTKMNSLAKVAGRPASP